MTKVTVNTTVGTWEGYDSYSHDFDDEAKALKFVAKHLKSDGKYRAEVVSEIIIHVDVPGLAATHDIMGFFTSSSVRSFNSGDVRFGLLDIESENGGNHQRAIVRYDDQFYKIMYRDGAWDYSGMTIAERKERVKTSTYWV
jgi:hypothetical protein